MTQLADSVAACVRLELRVHLLREVKLREGPHSAGPGVGLR